jgi:hypothetical protein
MVSGFFSSFTGGGLSTATSIAVAKLDELVDESRDGKSKVFERERETPCGCTSTSPLLIKKDRWKEATTSKDEEACSF